MTSKIIYLIIFSPTSPPKNINIYFFFYGHVVARMRCKERCVFSCVAYT